MILQNEKKKSKKISKNFGQKKNFIIFYSSYFSLKRAQKNVPKFSLGKILAKNLAKISKNAENPDHAT